MTAATRYKSFATAVAYLRVSTEDQNLGVDAQRMACLTWAEANGIEILGWSEDRCSGSTLWQERVGFCKALETAKVGVEFVVAARRDRFARDMQVMTSLEAELRKFGCRAVAAIDSPKEPETPEKELRNVIIDGFSQYERRLISVRTKAALAAKRARGEKLGAPGYRDSDVGKKLIAELKKFPVEMSWPAIAKSLNERGFKTLRGHEWTKGSVRSIVETLKLRSK